MQQTTQQQPPPFSARKRVIMDLGYGYVFVGDDGETYLMYDLSRYKPSILGKYVSPLTCWRREKLCFHNFKRPHLTCFRCDLRLAVSGKKPMIEPVGIQPVLLRRNANKLDKILSKLLCSLAEFFG